MRFAKIFLPILLLFSCASPYVGLKVNSTNWCHYNYAEFCFYGDENLSIKIMEFKKLSNEIPESEYYMKGYIDLSRGAFKSYSTLEESSFHIVFANDGITLKTVRFFPLDTSIQGKMPFSVKFKCPQFDSFTFIGDYVVSG